MDRRPPTQAFPRECISIHLFAFTFYRCEKYAPPKCRIGVRPSFNIIDIPDLFDRELKPRCCLGLSLDGFLPYLPKNTACRVRIRRCADIYGLWIEACGDCRDKGCLCITVQLLCLVKYQQITVLTSSAVSCPCKELHPCAVFQDNLLSSKCRFDVLDVFAEIFGIKKGRHFLKCLGSGLLQMCCVEHFLFVLDHTGLGSSLDNSCLAVLSWNRTATGFV